MADQRPPPSRVPGMTSHATSRTQRPALRVNAAVALPRNQHEHLQHQQQQVHSPQTMSQLAQQGHPPFYDHTGHGGQRPRVQLHHPAQSSQANSSSHFQSSVQPLTPQSPMPTDAALKKQIVSILASTANGCISELGYSSLRNEIESLRPAYNKLLEDHKALRLENADLKNENSRVTQLFREHVGPCRQAEGGDAQLNSGLQERIAQLEKENDLLRRQCIIHKQALSLNASDKYKTLESKYQYVLSVLKNHHAPVMAGPSGGNREVRISSPVAPAINQYISSDANGRNVIDLTISRECSQDDTTAVGLVQSVDPISQSDTMHPQSTQTNFSRPAEPSCTDPAASAQGPGYNSLPGPSRKPKLSRPASLPPSPSRPPPSPTVQEFAKPLPSEISATRTRISTDQNERLKGVQSIDDQQQNVLSYQTSKYTFNSVQPEIQNSQSNKVQAVHPTQGDRTMKNPPRHASSYQTQLHAQSVSVASAALPDPLNQPFVPSMVKDVKEARRISSAPPIASSSAHAESSTIVEPEAQPAKITPELAKVPTQDHAELRQAVRRTPTPLSLLSAQPTANDGQPASRRSGKSSPLCASSVVRSHVVIPEKTVSQPEEDLTSKEPSLPVPSASNEQPMDIDEPRPSENASVTNTQETKIVEEPSAVKIEIEPAATESVDESAVVVISENDEDDEDEDELWDDLTDDEDGQKQAVDLCVGSMFYDGEEDEDDERYCCYCNARLEQLNLPDPRPTFGECSMRDLIMHAKNEHSIVWEKLRRARPKS